MSYIIYSLSIANHVDQLNTMFKQKAVLAATANDRLISAKLAVQPQETP